MQPWPWGRFHAVPSDQTAVEVARHWRALVPSRTEGVSVDALAALLGVDVAQALLGAAAGGVEAALRPRRGSGWIAAIDPVPTPAEQLLDSTGASRGAAAQRRRWRLAHELAHTCFYGVSAAPYHQRLRDTDQAEERWCDLVAGALLDPLPAAESPSCAAQLLDWALCTSLPFAGIVAAVSARGHDVSALVLAGRSAVAYHGREPSLREHAWALRGDAEAQGKRSNSAQVVAFVDGRRSRACFGGTSDGPMLANSTVTDCRRWVGRTHAELGIDQGAA